MYYVYLLRCSDNSLYCGYTKSLEDRVEKHNYAKDGAKYTRSRRPVKLVYKESFETKSKALKREHLIKNMTKSQKEALVREN